MAEPTIAKRRERRFITHNVRDFLSATQTFGLKVLTPATLLEVLTK